MALVNHAKLVLTSLNTTYQQTLHRNLSRNLAAFYRLLTRNLPTTSLVPTKQLCSTPAPAECQMQNGIQLPADVLPIAERPKVELHVHIDGSVRPATVWEIAKDRDLPLPTSSVDEMCGLLNIPIHEAKTLTEFLQKFDIFMPYISGHPESIKRISYEFCEDLAKDRIIYAEARVSPHLLANSIDTPCFGVAKGNLTPRNVVQLVLEGLREGMKDFNVRVNLILCCMRHMPAWSPEVLDLCVEFRDKGVCGIDIAGDENITRTCPTQQQHVQTFKRAMSLGIHRTVHAGENGPPENVREAVYDMHAERIGHGYHAALDTNLYRKLISEDIHFELCPISSFLTGSVTADFDVHPIHRLAKDGANFSVNTDDPTLTGKYLLGEYKFAKETLKVSEKNLLISNLNAARSTFLPEDEKKALIDRLKEEYRDEMQFFGLNM